MNDIDEEGTFVSVNGIDVSYTKFPWWQPDRVANPSVETIQV